MTHPTGRAATLFELDASVERSRADYFAATRRHTEAARDAYTSAEALYDALRVRQQARIAAGVDAPVPCRDCLVEVPIVTGAGSYTAGYVHHEIVYDLDENNHAVPFATCGKARA